MNQILDKKDYNSPKAQFNKGKRLLGDGSMEAATRAFEKAYKQDKENALYMSYYGMCKAVRWGEVGLGLDLCTRAIKKEFYKAELYANLGRVYVAAGNKKGAITVVKKGFRHDPENEQLHTMMVELGVRRRPAIPSLKRSNFLNRILGRIRHGMSAPTPAEKAEKEGPRGRRKP
ncbi:MAG: tetratricopeptide repeat protein [Thermodesulfobacteriota bacterium]